MTELIFGRDGSEKTKYLLEKIKESLARGRRTVIIVPEQQALFWDDLTARNIPPVYALNTEVVSFTRLADSVFRRTGGAAKNYIGSAEKTLVMWNALRSVSDKLSVYGNIDREDRHVPVLCSAISELKLYSLTPADLIRAAEKLPDERQMLKNRLLDLSLIYAAYDEMLHISYDDPEECADALCKKLDGGTDYFDATDVFLDSFHTLTPAEMRIMRRVLALSDSVYITISMDDRDRDLPYFDCVWDYVKELVRLSAACGSEVVRHRCAESKNASLSYISQKLWDYSAAPSQEPTENVCIFGCADRHDEAVLCAARIKELTAAGASYSDIAVVASDFSVVSGICDKTLEDFGIPVYVSGRNAASSFPAVKLLLSACAVAAGGWKREDVTACAATGLCELSADQYDALERYTEIWNIRGKAAFCSDSGWSMNPDGYTAKRSRRGKEMLRLANEARSIIAPPLEAFCDAFGAGAAELCAAAYKLLCDFNVYESLKNETAKLEAAGDFDRAQKTSQVWGAVCNMLDTVAEIIPDAVLDAPRFAAVLRRLAQSTTVGTIPDGVDRVTVGSAASVKLTGVRHLIVLGAAAGEFPASPSENGFFSDADRAALKICGLELASGSRERMSENMFRFWHTVSSPCDSLTLLVPAGEDGEVRYSVGTIRCANLIPGARIADFSSEEGVESLRRICAKTGSIVPEAAPLCADFDRIPKEYAEGLFSGELYMTQSRIECFNDCAFKYYCRYVLSLDEGSKAVINPSDAGNFVHGVLEKFMREAAEDDVYPIEDSVIKSRSERLVREYIADVCPEGMPKRVEYLFSRLARSVEMNARELSEEFAHSRFRPRGFELKVGSEELPSYPIPVTDGCFMSVSGVVDRMDTYKDGDTVYLRVADYKTGAKSFRLSDVTEGKNVQLLLYLLSLCACPDDCGFRKKIAPDGERLAPAGAMYFSSLPTAAGADKPSCTPEAGEASASVSRSGIFLNDINIMKAMDDELSGRFLPVRFVKKYGEYRITGSSALVDADGMAMAERLMCSSLSQLGKRMLSGDGASRPSADGKSPCTWCAAAPVCRHGVRKAVEEGEGDGD